MKLQGSFNKVSRVFQESFMGVPRKIEGCFTGVLRLLLPTEHFFYLCIREEIKQYQYHKSKENTELGHTM